MSTSLKVDNINQLLEENRVLTGVTSSPTCLYLLYLIKSRPGITLDQIRQGFIFKSGTAEEWIDRILAVGLIEFRDSKYYLSSLGKRKLTLTDALIEKLAGTEIPGTQNVEYKLPDSYRLDCTPLGRGATSVTFRAIQQSTGRARTVKIFRPDIITYDQLIDFRDKRAKIPEDTAIPDFLGTGQFSMNFDTPEEPFILACQVFEYVDEDAKTLQEYVNTIPLPYLSRDFFHYFVEHVGGALEAIERAGLQHGDLHAGNILVIRREKREPAISFKVIDLAGASSFNSLSFSGITDLEMFKRHLLWCLSEVCKPRTGVSARELVGDAVERVIIGLRTNRYKTFSDVLDDFHKPAMSLPPGHFRTPPRRPFEWLRVEMMPSLKDLYLLFEPDDYILNAIASSENIIISGPRGCGKSHYLRVLNFWPEILKLAQTSGELKAKLDRLGYDFRRFFGVLFVCRVGEFKNFTPGAVEGKTFTFQIIRNLKYILILKIINKTLAVLRESCEKEILIPRQKIFALRTFIQERFPNLQLYGEPNTLEEMIQYARSLVTVEKEAESTWNLEGQNVKPILSEPDLEDFFEAIQKDFSELSQTQFFILVDDISEGRMHPEMQRVLNSIMTSATKRFSFKITCDKFTYTLDTAEDRAIDPYQDVVYVDLGDLSVKAQKTRKEISEYVRGIVNARLKAWIPEESDIVKLLGDSQDPNEFLRYLRLPRKANRQIKSETRQNNVRKKALYAGWNIIWQISHGSIRTLFQLLDSIFAPTNFDPKNPNLIPPHVQDQEVRKFSTQKFQSLLMLPGSIANEPVGTIISNIARVVGEVSRLYLRKYDTGDPDRYYETISLERLDLKPLSQRAAEVLKYLIVYDVFIIEGITFSRAQIGLSERYDLNKIYAPCFQITYRVRNHLFFRKGRFEELLLNPTEFIKKVRLRLDSLISPKQPSQESLFNDE